MQANSLFARKEALDTWRTLTWDCGQHTQKDNEIKHFKCRCFKCRLASNLSLNL